MFELPYKLSNNLRLRILENNKLSKKFLESLELMESPQPTTQKSNFDSWARKLRQISFETFQRNT